MAQPSISTRMNEVLTLSKKVSSSVMGPDFSTLCDTELDDLTGQEDISVTILQYCIYGKEIGLFKCKACHFALSCPCSGDTPYGHLCECERYVVQT